MRSQIKSHSQQRGSGRRPNRWGWMHKRPRWHWLQPTGAGWAPDPQVSWAQSCLAQIVGPWVPQNGLLGPSTRNAIQTFQTQHQLPPSGYLDPGTISALQAACSGAAPAAEPPPPPEPPEPAAAPPPDGSPAAEPPAASELSFGPQNAAREWVVNGPFAVDLDIHQRMPANTASQLAAIPNAPGVYVVFHGNTPWYVGIAEKSLKERIGSALTAATASQGLATNKDRFLSWASIRSAQAPKRGMKLVQPGKPPETISDGKKAILKMLQQILVRKHGTHNRGNRNSGVVRFTGAGQLVLKEKGRGVASFQSGQLIDTRGL